MTEAKASLYSGIVFLREIADGVSDELTATMRRVQVPRGATLFRQGEASTRALVLLEGQVRISVLTTGGTEMTLDVLAPGDTFGIVGLAGDVPYISNATATRRVTVLEIPTPTLRTLVFRHPQVSQAMLVQLLRRLGHSLQEQVTTGTQRVYARVAVKLLTLSAVGQGGRWLPDRLSHQEIASMVGSTRATVTRVLTDLRQRGIIDIDAGTRRLIIREAEMLSAMCDVDALSFGDFRRMLP